MTTWAAVAAQRGSRPPGAGGAREGAELDDAELENVRWPWPRLNPGVNGGGIGELACELGTELPAESVPIVSSDAQHERTSALLLLLFPVFVGLGDAEPYRGESGRSLDAREDVDDARLRDTRGRSIDEPDASQSYAPRRSSCWPAKSNTACAVRFAMERLEGPAADCCPYGWLARVCAVPDAPLQHGARSPDTANVSVLPVPIARSSCSQSGHVHPAQHPQQSAGQVHAPSAHLHCPPQQVLTASSAGGGAGVCCCRFGQSAYVCHIDGSKLCG